jgi:multidrug efflux pump subunit AcrA (membrane-fusion protein)
MPIRLHRPFHLAAGLAVPAAALLLLVSCGKAPKQAAAPEQVVATTVTAFGSVRPAETLAGIVAPFENVAISTTLSEPADLVTVQEGDRVRKGQLLARLNTADLQAALAADVATAQSNSATTEHNVYQGQLSIAQGVDAVRSAQTAVRQAQTTLQRDTTDLGRYQQLLAKGYISDQQVAQQEATVKNDVQAVSSAQASLQSAQSTVQANGSLGSGGLQESSVAQSRATEQVSIAQAQQQRVMIDKATILSPIDGVVVNRNLNPGEYPGTRQIFTLQQVDPIYAILRGSGAQIAKIAAGSKVAVAASDLGNKKFTGTVIGVLNQINPGSTDFQVKVLLPNPNWSLRPGMAVEANVPLPNANGIRIPATAFTDDSHSQVMVVADDGTVHMTHVVELGHDDQSAVVAGLSPGVRVVNDGQTSVADGQKVAIQ